MAYTFRSVQPFGAPLTQERAQKAEAKMGIEGPRKFMDDPTDYPATHDLLDAGLYLQVAEILQRLQVTSEQRGDRTAACMLSMAQQLCVACDQFRTEATQHRHACEEANKREGEFRQYIHAFLNLLRRREPSQSPSERRQLPEAGMVEQYTPESTAPIHKEHFNLWQRIKAIFGAPASVPSSTHEAPPAPAAKETKASAEPPAKEKAERKTYSLVIYSLGPFRVFQNNSPITDWIGLKGQCILKYLTAHQGGPVAKDILMDVFWPDADPEAARRNLHQAVYCLRQTLREEPSTFQHVQFENDCYLLNPAMDIWLDFEEFEKRVRIGRRLEANDRTADAMAAYGFAESLYQGDFLEEDLYEDWPRLQREHLRNAYLYIVDHLSDYYVQKGDYITAIAICQRVLAQDNCYEKAYRQLMKCYLAKGQRHLAIRQYQTCVNALKTELDLEPSEETVALYQHILNSA
jgi:DNA-binding SARP family transcriptional activator